MANLLSDDDVFGSAPSGLLSDADVFGKGAKKEPGGFVASAKQAIGATVKGAGQAAADFIPGVSQENALKRYGQEIIEANPTAVHSFSDLADKPWTAVKEATGNALSSMGGVVGSRALGMGITAAAPFTGPAAPVVAGAGQAISWLGPVAAAALPSFGGIREQQIHDDPNAANSAAAKAAAAVGAGTVGAIESRFGPEAWGSKMLTEAGRKEVAKLFAAKTLPQAVAKGAVRGAAVEGAEELAQNPVEQLAAFQNPLTAEALKDTAFSGAMGALGGGVLGGGTGAASRYLPKKPDVDPGNQPAEPPKALPAPTYTGTPGDQTLQATVDRQNAVDAAQAAADAPIRYEPGLVPGVDVGGPTEPPSPPGGGIDFTPPQLPDTGPLSRAANLALGASVPMERQTFFPFQSFAAAERMRNGRDDLVTRQHPSIPGRFTLVPAGLETPVARQAKPDVQQGTGSFSDQNELANFIADERKDQSVRKAALAEGKNNAIAQADQAVADARQFATRNERLSILDGVLSSLAPGQNPNRRFDAALKAAGFRDTSFTEEERAVIGRYGNVASAFAVAPEASVEPSSPGEIEAAIPAAKGKGDSGIAGVRADRVRSAIAAGFTQRKGFSLINPATGEKFALKTPGMIRAAKEALEKLSATNTENRSDENTSMATGGGEEQRPEQIGSQGNLPTVAVGVGPGDYPVAETSVPSGEPAVSVGDGSERNAALSEQKSTAKPRRTRMTPLDDPRISKHAESLQAMAGDVGWAEVGGRLIRDANGNANARTRWIPHAEWFRAGMIGRPEDARRAVAKAVSGTPMPVKEKRTIQGMMDWLDHVDAHPNEAEALADMGYDDLTEPEQEARDALGDFDPLNPPVGDVAAGMRALGFTEEEIRAEIEGSQSRDSGQGDGVDNGIAGRGPQESLPGRDETRPSASEGQGPDERPSLELERQTDQGLADKAAREQEPQEPTKEQADRERDAAPFSLSEQSQPKPQGVQSGLFTADGRVSVEAKQPEKPAEVTKPKNEQQEAAGLPAATDGGSRPVPAVSALEETFRPLIERLIRNKRVAKELGFDIDGAIAKAKAAMAGAKQMPGSFRALAKRAEKKGDTETAAILNQIADLNDGRKAKAALQSAGDKQADDNNAQSDATLSRTRSRSEVTFSEPYTGATGAKLVGYAWMHKKEEFVDHRGEDRVRTVSDWEQAADNLETGRQIVHLFFVQKQDGTEQEVSAETAADLLGISESAVRSNAKRRLEHEIAKAKKKVQEINEANAVDAVAAKDSPAKAVESMTVFGYSTNAPMVKRLADNGPGWFKIEDKIPRESAQNESYRFLERDGKFIWSSEFVKAGSELERRGWKTVELLASEVWPAPKIKTAIPEWHTKLPAEGMDIIPGDEKINGPTNVVIRAANDAYNAITQTQFMAGVPFYAYVKAAADGRHGIVRLLPDDQAVPAGWKLVNGEGLRIGGMTKEQIVQKLNGWLRREPIIGERAKHEEVKPANVELKKGDRFKDGHGKTWEVWTARTSLVEAFPVIDGKIKVSRDDGVRFATDERARLANPEARTDVFQLDSGIGSEPITDFGEKLGGARKDDAAALRDAVSRELSDEELATQPLSKIWPKESIDEIEDPFIAVVAHAARAEIPAKPRVAYKVAGWVGKVKVLRGLASAMLNRGIGRDFIEKYVGEHRGLRHFAQKVALLEMIGRENWDRIGKVEAFPEAYRYAEDGTTHIPAPHVYVEVDGKAQRYNAKRVDDVVESVRAILGEAKPAAKIEFEIRGREGSYFINKKGDPLYRKLKTFDSVKEASEFRNAHYDDLVSAWESVKESDNVKETDVRSKENRPRSAEDWRKGKDVPPEQFASEFGFRGVEWGNWVSQGTGAKDRQGMLNQAYDALMDLADIIGVPPKALSLNGSLGIGFGSRGHGWASAHFEPSNLVINLTKTRGAGALAHEWFHALDNYFQTMRGKPSGAKVENWFITYNPENYYVHKQSGQKLPARAFEQMIVGEKHPIYGVIFPRYRDRSQWELKEGVRPKVGEAFADLVKALNDSPMAKRASLIDKGKSGGYWSRIIERGARSFENYVISKMMEKGYHNDYLANVRPVEDFPRSKERYPYLLPEEVKPIAEAFDSLFSVIESRETEKGVALESRATSFDSSDAPQTTMIRRVVDSFLAHFKGAAALDIRVVASRNDIPQRYRPSPYAEGVYHDADGVVYLISSNLPTQARAWQVLMHEAIGHYGLSNLMGEKFAALQATILQKATSGRELTRHPQPGEADYATVEAVRRLYPEASDSEVAQEVLARMAEMMEPPGWSKILFAQVRHWLRTAARAMNLTVEPSLQEAKDAVVLAAKHLRDGKNLEREMAGEGQAFASEGAPRLAPNGKPSRLNAHQWKQVRTPEFKAWFGDWEASAILNGEPLASMKTADAPSGGFKAVEDWAASLFAEQGGVAVREGLGEVLLDRRAAKTSMAHGGANQYKKVAFAAVKDVIERGALVHRTANGDVDSFYFSAPVDIDGVTNIETVLVHRDANTGRMYLHSVMAKESLLNHQVSRADAGASERSGSTDSEGISRILQDLVRRNGVSKVVDENGEPRVVYHGTNRDFNIFKTKAGPRSQMVGDWDGVHFTNDLDQAQSIADSLSRREGGEPKVVEAYLLAENPTAFGQYRTKAQAEAKNHDSRLTENNTGLQEWTVFSPTQIKSATGNNGNFSPANPDIRESRSSGPATWQAPDPSRLDDLIYSMQDKHVDMKRVVQSIKQTAGTIADNIDPYLQEELFHGRAAKAVKDFLDLELRPLIAEMRMRGVGMADFEEYLWNRHAEERNAQIAKINPQMPDGGSGLATADAMAYLAGLSSDKRKAYESLAAKIDAITARNRQVLVDSGLEKAETVAAWEGAYKHYVPLQREDVETGGNGTGQGFSVRGTSSKRAVGSGRPVADIIANLAMQRERFIVKAEKNRVSIAIAGLAVSNPNPDFWKIDDAPKERVVETIGGQDQVVERTVPSFRTQENVVHFRLNGEDHFVIFNEREPRAMRMAQSIKNLDMDQLGRVLTVAGKVTRYFAAINTQYNPIFGIINLFRDVQGALLNLSTTPLAGEQKRVAGYTVDALRGIYADIRAHRAGKVPSSRWASLYEEFQNEGGQTGYRDQFSNAEQRAEAIAKEIKAMDRNAAFKAAGAVFDWLSDYNQAMENAVRLAAYAAAKERGLSKQQAASLAKNLTVNFNRKGQVATQMGALYAFFNASMQGTARLAQTLTGPMGRRIITGGILLGSMQALLLASAGMGDDEPPEFVRERNLILPIGDGKYISLPMPLGFHVLPNLGRIPVEFVMSGFREPARRISDLVAIFADTFNPIGNAGLSLQTIAPTVVDPFAALAENKDWTGKPIAKMDMNANSPTPGHNRAKDTSTVWSKSIAEAINYLSGGTKYKPGVVSPTPDQIDYLIGQVTGGVGREAAKAEQTVTSTIFTGEELPLHKVPLVGRFVGDTKGQSAEGSKFYAALQRINEHENEIKGMRKDGRGAEIAGYIQDNPEARLMLYSNHVEREVQKLRAAKRDALERGDEGRVRMIESALTAKMRAFNERVRSAQGSAN